MCTVVFPNKPARLDDCHGDPESVVLQTEMAFLTSSAARPWLTWRQNQSFPETRTKSLSFV